ncbi:hypothetical protein ACS6BO_005243, partial [Escherichia coli]
CEREPVMKNLATWLLAAAFTTAALPAFAVEPSVQVGYSPEGSARVLVLSAIDSAKTSIRMMAYSFTAPDIGGVSGNPRKFRHSALWNFLGGWSAA